MPVHRETVSLRALHLAIFEEEAIQAQGFCEEHSICPGREIDGQSFAADVDGTAVVENCREEHDRAGVELADDREVAAVVEIEVDGVVSSADEDIVPVSEELLIANGGIRDCEQRSRSAH